MCADLKAPSKRFHGQKLLESEGIWFESRIEHWLFCLGFFEASLCPFKVMSSYCSPGLRFSVPDAEEMQGKRVVGIAERMRRSAAARMNRHSGVKGYVYSITCMKARGECRCSSTLALTSVLDGRGCLMPLYRRERFGTYCTGCCVSSRIGLDGCEKSRLYRNSIPGPFST
jgi:hypothetical protein